MNTDPKTSLVSATFFGFNPTGSQVELIIPGQTRIHCRTLAVDPSALRDLRKYGALGVGMSVKVSLDGNRLLRIWRVAS